MEFRVIEQSVSCPFCAENITLLVDLSVTDQSYIEDCQVCCQPMQVNVNANEDEQVSIRVCCAN